MSKIIKQFINGFNNIICPVCKTELSDAVCPKCGFRPVLISQHAISFMYGRDDFDTTARHFPDLSNNLLKDQFALLLINVSKKLTVGHSGLFIDVGCGTGFYSYNIFKDNPAVQVIGLDVNPSFNLNYTGKNYSFVQADIFSAPFKEGTFDGAVSFDVIEHIENDYGFLAAIIKLLKPGGLFIIGTPNRNRITSVIEQLFKGEKQFPYNYGYNPILGETIHIREYDKKNIEQLFTKFGKEISFNIYPLLLGIRFGKKIMGLPVVPNFISAYCYYWVVSGVKK